jgi:AcrR family transcriptional regulator
MHRCILTHVAGVKRDAQRRRTRRAILAAAADLLRAGETPSMGEVAEAADVSRRTVYLHFASIEHLLADAALEAQRAVVEPEWAPKTGAAERLEAMVRALQSHAGDSEDLGRTIVRHTVGAKEMEDGQPRRGYRRVAWIEDALAPARTELGDEAYERLVSALTLLVGWEALIILRDIRGLDAREAEDVCAWAAGGLLRAATALAPSGPVQR